MTKISEKYTGKKRASGNALSNRIRLFFVICSLIFDRHANLKYRYGDRLFWCRGYYVDTVGKNEKKIAEYVREQLQDDIANDQISLKEYIDPFSGKKVKK